MKHVKLSNEEISSLCMGLFHQIHAGIGMGDALALMAEDDPSVRGKDLLSSMAKKADEGGTPSDVFSEAQCFPPYLCNLLEVGRLAGKTEETLYALATHYESRARLQRHVRDAILYPAMLSIIMLVVVVILLVWVLPVFNDVYALLGSRLTGIAGSLLLLGTALRRIMPVLCIFLAIAAGFFVLSAVKPQVLSALASIWQKKRGDCGLGRKINTARLMHGLSLGLSSGMPAREALTLAMSLTQDTSAFDSRCKSCLLLMDQGESLSTALRQTELLSPSYCRLLDAGIRSGQGETAMETIAERLSEDCERALESSVSRIEPTLVILTSALIGIILLTVMLPLMHIMTGLGG